MSFRADRRRWGALTLVGTALTLVVLLPWPWQVTDDHDPVGSAALMLCAAVLWTALCWLALAGAATLLSQAAGTLGACARRLTTWLVPVALRGLLVTAIGTGSSLALLSPAAAAEPAPLPDQGAPATQLVQNRAGQATADSGFVIPDIDWPDSESGSPGPESPTPESAGSDPGVPGPGDPPTQRILDPDGAIVVLRGDTLWAIAAADLPAGSDDAAVQAHCAAWYAANRDVIGDDPDLILPGQRLLAPSPDHQGADR